jgi:hypothetical protein
MQIFDLWSDNANFKRLRTVESLPLDYFDGSRKLATWVPMPVRCSYPERADFDIILFSGVASLIITSKTRDVLDRFFSVDNIELLPLSFEAQQFFIVNILGITACAEEVPAAQPGSHKNLIFFPEQIKRPIFKLTPHGSIYVVEKTGDPATEFKAAVEHHGLRGLRFKRIWSDQTPEERTAERHRNRPPAPEGMHDLEEIFDYAAWRGEEQPGPLVKLLLDACGAEHTFLACNAPMAWLAMRARIRDKIAAFQPHPFFYQMHPFAPAVLQLIQSSSELQRLFHVAREKKGFTIDFRPDIEESRRMEIEQYALRRSKEHWK